MKIIKYTEIEPVLINNESAKAVKGRVLIGKDDGADHFCMRVFTLGPDGFTPRHSHEWEHEIFVHAGSGKIFLDGEWQEVAAGTAIFVPGGEVHQLMNTTNEEFVFICLIPAGVPEL
ncbi:cupin domain-containing protein [Desulforhopalus vacuolatus]|uniref:cupin domain-containing protein n=1 Tax=Desulforhopalus vacuolatus TaxID=40414 RepID=UPI001963C6D9|nr:cupin domain-containing protein [Desulforhopalus vacuolatus]MBM9519256.1 cupin domain-containing protein [Desulforhopalus vacuolatus]